jgi:hypothetical protein
VLLGAHTQPARALPAPRIDPEGLAERMARYEAALAAAE